ncbi:hypothetical protein [Kiloniella sp.]|uniref:hypothetical protein n=1 Tax=Kiloniella sp. TaxID=1938587 RepID=UPI003A935473
MRKITLLLNACIVMTLASCVTTTEEQRIVSEQHFRDVVVEKKLSNTRVDVTLKLTQDGLIEGTEPSGEIKGTWLWDGTRFCRDVTTGPLKGKTCQVVTLKDTKVSVKDVEGKIRTATYRISE